MVSKKSRTEVRVKKHNRMRNHLAGTAQRPRLAVFRSNNHMYAQIIDDTVGNTLVSASTLDKDLKAELEKTNNVDAAAKLGTVIAKKALDKGITTVVFDRGGFIYAGKGKALAEAAREAGLEFLGGTNMKREIIDASQLELVDQVFDIKRVTKVVRVDVTCASQLSLLLVTRMVMLVQVLERLLKFLKQSAKEKKMQLRASSVLN